MISNSCGLVAELLNKFIEFPKYFLVIRKFQLNQRLPKHYVFTKNFDNHTRNNN